MGTVTVEDIHRLLKPSHSDELSRADAQDLTLQLIILCVDPIDTNALKYLSRFFTPMDYTELVGERTVLSRCGYPTCPHMLRDSRGDIRNPSSHTVLPWQHEYCQLSCYQAGEFYKEQLSREPLETRKDITRFPFGDLSYEQNVILLPEVKVIAHMNKQTVSETVGQIIKNQRLVTRLQELEIESKPAQSAHISDGAVAALSIKERY